ncbi:MAG: Response regulator ArlR [Stenotrophomonas maltophilia]|nr:MAG: Response regulator ArlR [Stenotrophomonas maltophilia]
MALPASVPRVLVAAPDHWSRELLGQLVESVRCDAQIEYCQDGQQAVAACRQQRFALILAEQELAGFSGLDLLRAVRQMRRNEGLLPFILISARADAASVREAIPLAPTAYLAKPFNAENLLQRLRGLLLQEGQAVSCALPEHQAGLTLEGFLERERDETEGAPLLASVAQLVTRCLHAEACDLGEIEREFVRDPQITARLIAAANSAARHAGAPCQTLGQALARLGIGQCMNLVLGLSLQRAAQLRHPLLTERATEFWNLSQTTADLAHALAESMHLDVARCYTAGLLHCLGDLALLRSLQDWADGGGALSEEDVPRMLREFGASFGSTLRARWRLPLELRELIAAAYALGSGVYSREALVLHLAAQAARMPVERRGELAELRAARMLRVEPRQLELLKAG